MLQRAIIVLIILAVLVGGGTYAYQLLLSGAEEDEGPVYATAPVTRGDLRVAIEGFGNLEPIWSQDIQTDTGGFLEELTVKQGDEVFEGQVVGRLRNDNLMLELRKLEMELARAKSGLAMTLGISEDRVLEADPDRGISVTAPISGRVTELRIKPDDVVEQASMIARIVDDSQVVIDAEFNPAQFASVKDGDVVSVRPLDFSDILEGLVVDANPSRVPKGDHFVHEVVIVVENPGLLRPGQEVQILVGGQTAVDATISRYYDETAVWSSGEGTVMEVPVRAWERVSEGETLGRLGGAESRQYIFDRQMDIRDLEGRLMEKMEEVDRLVIRSPIDGTVAWAHESYGWEMSPGTHIAAIIDNTKMNLGIQVDEIDVVHIESGMEAEVAVEAFPGDRFPAVVMRVDTMGSDEQGVTVYRVQLEVEQTKKIRPGMTANVSIFVNEASDVLRIPIEAVYQEDGSAMVDVYEDGKAVPTGVELGYVSSRYVEVKTGLEEGQMVVTGSSRDLLDKEEVDGADQPIIPTPERPEPEPAPRPGTEG
ncbi:MAG: efflux RND transporter periplasmic adaptor subunit [Bacillota bacterium]